MAGSRHQVLSLRGLGLPARRETLVLSGHASRPRRLGGGNMAETLRPHSVLDSGGTDPLHAGGRKLCDDDEEDRRKRRGGSDSEQLNDSASHGVRSSLGRNSHFYVQGLEKEGVSELILSYSHTRKSSRNNKRP
ncbi:uncharacterized protein LOC122265893 [Penaeus japonicus]|uniref:uncharacterized protein LOC122265893 n=1 Tax=Penaeus japonicus TaxID=27405 RepID=UPI001C70E693|nr:uncharacterized protein LOC122265893 [Penaeus japonicus]